MEQCAHIAPAHLLPVVLRNWRAFFMPPRTQLETAMTLTERVRTIRDDVACGCTASETMADVEVLLEEITASGLHLLELDPELAPVLG